MCFRNCKSYITSSNMTYENNSRPSNFPNWMENENHHHSHFKKHFKMRMNLYYAKIWNKYTDICEPSYGLSMCHRLAAAGARHGGAGAVSALMITRNTIRRSFVRQWSAPFTPIWFSFLVTLSFSTINSLLKLYLNEDFSFKFTPEWQKVDTKRQSLLFVASFMI